MKKSRGEVHDQVAAYIRSHPDGTFAVTPAEREEPVVEGLKACMGRASKGVIGVEIPVEVKVTRYPDRYVPDKKPKAMETWGAMMSALETIERGEPLLISQEGSSPLPALQPSREQPPQPHEHWKR